MEIDLAQSGFNANLAQNAPPVISRLNEKPETDAESERGSANGSLARLQALESSNVSQENADNIISEGASQQDIEVAVGEVRDFVQSQRRNLDFTFNQESNQSIVQVTDNETGELIRQIPSEEVLALSDRIKGLQSDLGEAVGVLFSREV